MSKTLYNMSDLEIAQSFVDFIPVEGVFEAYSKWLPEKDKVEKNIDKVVKSLEAGGLTRVLRKKKTAQREKMRSQLIKKDPRLLQKTRFDSWLQSIGVTNGDFDKARGKAFTALDNAMKDADAIQDAGLPPFVLMRSGTGSNDHYKIMDLKDYALEKVRTKSMFDENQAKRQQKEFDRLMITVKDHYGELPAELEAAADNVRLTIDFKRRMANVLGEMVQESMKVIEHQSMKANAENKLLALEEDLSDATTPQ